MIHTVITTAAANNAAWCASMCRTHDLPTTADGRVWRSARRTPMYYPDAVTLAPGVPAAEVLDGIDTSPGCSVKDSFADLDLSPYGFFVLFEGEWITRAPAEPAPTAGALDWTAVRDAAGLAAWEKAWDGGAPDLFAPALLDDPDVAVIAGCDAEGHTRAGAVLNLSARTDGGDGGESTGVVGVSNVFDTRVGDDVYDAVARTAAALHPGVPLVGYETDGDLAAALAQGFTPLGPLRVWLRS